MALIDELLLRLRIDSSGFGAAADRARQGIDSVETSAKNTQSALKTMQGGIVKVRNELLALFGIAASVSGMKSYTDGVIKQTAAQGYLADSIGTTTLRLRAYEAAAERGGGSSAAMVDALKKSATDLAALKQGSKTWNDIDPSGFITRYSGMTPDEIKANSESLLNARLKAYDRLKNARPDELGGADPAALATSLAEQSGLSAGVLNPLKNGYREFLASVREQEIKLVPLASMAEQAIRTNQAVLDLRQQFHILGTQIVTSAIAPEVEKLSKSMTKMTPEQRAEIVDGIKSIIDQLETFGKLLVSVGSARDFPDAMDAFTEKTTGFQKAVTGLMAFGLASWLFGVAGALTAVGAAFAGLAAYAGFQFLPESTKKYLGEKTDQVMSFFGNDEATKRVGEKNQRDYDKRRSERMGQVYESFTRAGLSPAQAAAMTSEVGRENDFRDEYLFGSHTDKAGGRNLGMISWQGSRRVALEQSLMEQGLFREGKIVPGQEGLDAQARFIKSELESGKFAVGEFINDPNISKERSEQILGKNYVKWAIGQRVLRNGQSFDDSSHRAKRSEYYDEIRHHAATGTQTRFPAGSQHNVSTKNVNIGHQTFNIKSDNPEAVRKEVASKSLMSESLTQNFNSGVR